MTLSLQMTSMYCTHVSGLLQGAFQKHVESDFIDFIRVNPTLESIGASTESKQCQGTYSSPCKKPRSEHPTQERRTAASRNNYKVPIANVDVTVWCRRDRQDLKGLCIL